jgi:hypothetical protein
MLAALDLATGKMIYRIRERKRWQGVLVLPEDPPRLLARRQALRDPRQLRPSPVPRRANVGGRPQHRTGLFTTSASWLNWIEAEFAALRYFALGGTDHRSHAQQAEAIAGYMRWRNTRAQPKRDFAPDSVIRDLDRLPDQRCLTRHSEPGGARTCR